MKINICDICYLKDDKIVKSKWRKGYTHGQKLDFCEKHHDWQGKKGTTREQFYHEYNKLNNEHFERHNPDIKPHIFNAKLDDKPTAGKPVKLT